MDLKSRRCICFDCDSTLSSIEGIDELAVARGLAHEIEPLTTAAMEGRLTIEAVYARRLEILRPGRAQIERLAQRYLDTIVPGAQEAVHRLKQSGREVFIVSGGLRTAILPLAAALGVADGHVEAVDVYFDAAGSYAGFDEASPLTRSDGKASVTASLARRYGPAVLVGDGMTDVAAKSAGAFVVGFGGVVRRAAVVQGADTFVDGPSLMDVARLLIS